MKIQLSKPVMEQITKDFVADIANQYCLPNLNRSNVIETTLDDIHDRDSSLAIFSTRSRELPSGQLASIAQELETFVEVRFCRHEIIGIVRYVYESKIATHREMQSFEIVIRDKFLAAVYIGKSDLNISYHRKLMGELELT